MSKDVITKKIGSIDFGLVSPSVMRKIGVINVVTPEIYDSDGYPVKKGLMDPNMGVIDPGLRCKTCGGRMKTCPGHFGYISLSKPVLHILYVKRIYKILSSTCEKCGRLMLSQDKIDEWKEKMLSAKRERDVVRIRGMMKTLYYKQRRVKSCPYCNSKRNKVTFVKPTSFKLDGKRIWPAQIREWLEKIPDSDLRAMGYNSDVFRPEWAVLKRILVPPITVRPSITLQSGERSEDDLTHKLSDVVRVNQRLLENINAGAPEIIVEDLWDLLQYHVTTFYNNKVSQIPPAKHRTRRPLKTLVQRLSGKEGRFRYNLAGKRVNFCARSVISPDPNLNIDEIGIPFYVVKELTIPERVTEWNITWLKSLIKNIGNYPSANYVFTDEGRRKKITKETVDTILEQIGPRWIVERNLLEGDAVVFNRQPSLHKMSMMGHKLKLVDGNTFRINPAVCAPYNADFDGDEMNLHLPQTEESRSEVANILDLKKQIITPRYGYSIIGPIQDILLGIFYLTKNMYFDKKDVSDLAISIDYFGKLPKPAKKEKGESLWHGRQLFSLLLPEDFNYEGKGLVYKKNEVEEGKVQIKKGQLLKGVINKRMIGGEGGVLIHEIDQNYGSDATAEFVNKLNKLGLAISRKIAYTMSFYDLEIPESERKRIKKVLESTNKEADKLVEKYHKKGIALLPGKTEEESFEANILKTLSHARNKASKIIGRVVKKDSTLVNSAKAGAGDKILNIVLMSGFAGQQALRGKRISYGYTDRTLSHFKKKDLGPRAHGFIKNGYAHGLDPIELFFNSMVGRDALMDTAMRTPKSGYMQRRLVNALQDLKVGYDGTVRNSGKEVIQFRFGGDGVDVSKSRGGKIIE